MANEGQLSHDHEQVIISFGMPIAEANAAAVAAALHAFVTIMEAAQKEVKPSERLAIKARAPTAGSYEIPIDITLLPEYVGQGVLFLGAAGSAIKAVLDILKQVLEIKRLGRGNPIPAPDTNGNVVLQNCTFNVQNGGTFNLLVNPTVNEAIGKAAVAIEADDKIEDVKILQGNDRVPLVKVERSELRYLRYDGDKPAVEVPPPRDRPTKATLVVRSPDLVGDSRWAFTYQGHRIEATIQDKEFIAEVRSCVRAFTGGTVLVADLNVEEEYDLESKAYAARRYAVVKVYQQDHQPQLPDSTNPKPPSKAKGVVKAKGSGKGKSNEKGQKKKGAKRKGKGESKNRRWDDG